MPGKFIAITAVLTVAVIAAALLIPTGGNGGSAAGLTPISDETEYRRILENAKGKLVVVDFYADWCSPCRQLAPILERVAAQFKEEVAFYKVNVDTSRDLARQVGVRGIPYVLFLHGDKPVHAMMGLNPREAYVRAIQRFAPKQAQAGAEGPDGKLVDGVRVVERSAQAAFDSVYVYRGETVRLTVRDVNAPYGIAIPQYGIQKDAVPGQPLEVTFKAKKTGVFPVFCNGSCPAGEASRHGQVVVMPFEASDRIAYAEIDAPAARALIDADAAPLILDVRTPGEYYAGHIQGARLIPVQQLQARIGEIAGYKNKKILVYCRSGNRSVVASEILVGAGFTDIAHLRGGILDWQRAGYATVK